MASTVHRPEEQSSKTHPEVENKQLKNEGFSAHDFETTSGRKSYFSSQETTPERNISPGFERPKG